MKIEYQRLLLAATLAGGFAAVWGVAGLWAAQLAESDDGPTLRILGDGTAVVSRGKTASGVDRYEDLDGNTYVMPDGAARDAISTSYWPAPSTPSAGRVVPWNQRIRPCSDGQSPATFWYFMTDGKPDGLGWFVGYDSHSNRRAGYIGRSGFCESQPPPDDCFRVPTGDHTCVTSLQPDRGSPYHPDERSPTPRTLGGLGVWETFVRTTGGTVYRVDLRTHAVGEFYRNANLRQVALVSEDLHEGQNARILPAVRLADAIVLLELDGSEYKRYPISPSLRDRNFSFCQTVQGDVILLWSNRGDVLGTAVDHHICWSFANGGCKERSITLTCPPDLGPLPLQGVLVPCPALACVLPAISRPEALLEAGTATSYPDAVLRAVVEYWPAIAVAQLIAVALAILCYRRLRLYGQSTADCVRWSVFVLLLGLPGWVGFRFGRAWPPLTACAGCAAAVPYDRDGCARCAADFPRPQLLGTEVFA